MCSFVGVGDEVRWRDARQARPQDPDNIAAAEVAVRLALGATRSDVFRLLLQRGLRPVAVGLVAGVLAAAASARLIRSLLFGVQPTDPLTMLLVLAVLACAAFSACVVPARRAVRLDPAITLRYE